LGWSPHPLEAIGGLGANPQLPEARGFGRSPHPLEAFGGLRANPQPLKARGPGAEHLATEGKGRSGGAGRFLQFFNKIMHFMRISAKIVTVI